MHTPVPAPGDLVWIRQRRWRVERARIDGRVIRLDVQNRHTRLTFLAPFDRAAPAGGRARVRHVRPQQAVARLAALIGGTCPATLPHAALDAGVDLLPHQLEPVLAVLTGARRLLIADEVGLGKTIQAGLILSELQRRLPAFRALVIVPAGLRDQWEDELRARFRLSCEHADRVGLDRVSRASSFGENAWRRPGVWLASADYLKQPHVLEGIPLIAWDAIVIDEAHDASGPSERHAACDALARRARRVLLLSATPHDGDRGDFQRLCDLGRLPGAAADPLLTFRRTRADVALPSVRHVRWRSVPLSIQMRQLLDALVSYERAVLAAPAECPAARRVLLLSVFRKRALSSVHALRLSLLRRLDWLSGRVEPAEDAWMQPRLQFEPSDEITGEEWVLLRGESGLQDAEERAWLRRLHELATAAATHDDKLRTLVRLIGRVSEPVVIFTEFRESLEAVVASIGTRRRVAAIHGRQHPHERREQLSRFLGGDADVLVATDVAGQGLNLQSRTRWIVTLELPWTPSRLEQRIGRIDRIGQRKPVHATLLIARHATEDALLASLARRALAVDRALSSATSPDVGSGAPGELASMLIGGAPLREAALLEAPPGRTVTTCTRFRRRARAAARVLRVRRRLVARWRGSLSTCPLWTSTRTLQRIRHVVGASFVVVAVPLVDRNAMVVERRLVAWQCRLPPPAAAIEALHHAATASAARAMEARRRRVERILAHAAARAAESDTAIGAHLRALSHPEQAQPALFGRDTLHAIEASRAAVTRVTREERAQRLELERLAEIRVGRASIEMLFVG